MPWHPTCLGATSPCSIFLETKKFSTRPEDLGDWLSVHSCGWSVGVAHAVSRGEWVGRWVQRREGGRNLQKLAHENIERKRNLKQNIHDEHVNFLRGGFHKYRSNPPQRMELWQEARNVMSSWWRLHFGVGRSKEEHTRTNRAKL